MRKTDREGRTIGVEDKVEELERASYIEIRRVRSLSSCINRNKNLSLSYTCVYYR